MQFVFSDKFLAGTGGTGWDLDTIFPTSAAAAKLKITLLTKCPYFVTDGEDVGSGEVSHISSIDTLTDLLADPAYQEVMGTQAHTAPTNLTKTISRSNSGDTRSVTVSLNEYEFWSAAPTIVQGFVLSLDHSGEAWDDHIVCVMRPDEPFYLTGTSTNKAVIEAPDGFFSYTAGPSNSWLAAAGSISFSVPVLDWESSRAAHVWLDPQRVNFVANPTFQNNTNLWRTTGTLTRVSGGMNRDGQDYCGQLVGTDPVLESNLFPATNAPEGWTVQAMVSGVGNVRIGMVFWPMNMDEANAYYLHSDWVPVSDSGTTQDKFKKIHLNLPPQETVKEALVRIEFDGGVGATFHVDEVMAEPNLGDAGYFDGSFDLGQPSDFSWYGGSSHASFSIYYGNRKNLRALIFGYTDSEGEKYRGEAERWVPEGVTVIPHWDDVFSLRLHSWMDDITFPIKDYTNKGVVTSL